MIITDAIEDADRLVGGSDLVLDRLGARDDGTRSELLARLERIRSEAHQLSTPGTGDVSDRAADLADEGINAVSEALPQVTTLDPTVLVRPFDSRTEAVVPVRVEAADFFTLRRWRCACSTSP